MFGAPGSYVRVLGHLELLPQTLFSHGRDRLHDGVLRHWDMETAPPAQWSWP